MKFNKKNINDEKKLIKKKVNNSINYLENIDENVSILLNKNLKYNKNYIVTKKIAKFDQLFISELLNKILSQYDNLIIFSLELKNWGFGSNFKLSLKQLNKEKLYKKLTKKINLKLKINKKKVILKKRINFYNEIKAISYKKVYNRLFKEFGYKFYYEKISHPTGTDNDRFEFWQVYTK